MTTPTEENFKYYKKSENKALEILAEMKATTPKKMDIELALLITILTPNWQADVESVFHVLNERRRTEQENR